MSFEKKITVIVTTYNHEKYIAKCLESILKQRDVDFEVIAADDFSSDNTLKIIKEFAAKDSRIKVLETSQNLGMQKNLKRAFDKVLEWGAYYMAVCEGDDYWIDDLKLLKMSRFMDENPSFSMCFSSILFYYQEKDEYRFRLTLTEDTECIGIKDLIKFNHIANFSCCFYRRKVIEELPQKIFEDKTMADWLFNLACAEKGDIGFIFDPMSVYRIHGNSLWSSQSDFIKLKSYLEIARKYNKFFNNKYDKEFSKLIYSLEKEVKFQRYPLLLILRKIIAKVKKYVRKG